MDGPDDDGYAERSEYDRFHALISKLVKVPKKELDEARKREQAAKS